MCLSKFNICTIMCLSGVSIKGWTIFSLIMVLDEEKKVVAKEKRRGEVKQGGKIVSFLHITQVVVVVVSWFI